MLKRICYYVSKKKFLKNLHESKEFKDYTKTDAMQITIDQHKKKWEEVTEDNFKPLSSADKKVQSKYKFLQINKKNINKKIKQNYDKEIKKQALQQTNHFQKLNNKMTTAQEIANKLNILELKRFQRINFNKKMKQKFIDREKSYPQNYISGNQEFYEKELTNDLNSMDQTQQKQSKITQYEDALRQLKNTKINELITDYQNDEQLQKYLLSYNREQNQIDQIKDNKEYMQQIELQQNQLTTIPGINNQNNSIQNIQNKQILNLTKEQFNLANYIKEFENQIFQQNRTFFENPQKFTDMDYQTQKYYLRKYCKRYDQILNLNQSLIDQNYNSIIYKDIYFRLSQTFFEKYLYYKESDYIDLFTIKNEFYYPLLKKNLRLLNKLDFQDFSNFLFSFCNIHQREQGQLIGTKKYEKISFYLYNSLFYRIDDLDFKNFENIKSLSICLDGLLQNKLIQDSFYQSEETQVKLFQILKNIDYNIDVKSSSIFLRVFQFIVQMQSKFQQNQMLNQIIYYNMQLLQENRDVLVNTRNIQIYSKLLNDVKLDDKQTLLRKFLRGTMFQKLQKILNVISLDQLSDFSTLLVNSKNSDFSFFNLIRKDFFDKFFLVQKFQAFKIFKLINNIILLDLYHNKIDLFSKQDQLDPNMILLYALIFQIPLSDVKTSIKITKFHEVFDEILLQIKNCNSKELIEILKSIVYLKYLQNEKANQIVEEAIDQGWDNFSLQDKISIFCLMSFNSMSIGLLQDYLQDINQEIKIQLSQINEINLNAINILELLIGVQNIGDNLKENYFWIEKLFKEAFDRKQQYLQSFQILFNFFGLEYFNNIEQPQIQNQEDLNFFEKIMCMFIDANINLEDSKFLKQYRQYSLDQLTKSQIEIKELQFLLQIYSKLSLQKLDQVIVVDKMIKFNENFYAYVHIYYPAKKTAIFVINDIDQNFDEYLNHIITKKVHQKINESGYNIKVITFSKLKGTSLNIKDVQQYRLEQIKNLLEL